MTSRPDVRLRRIYDDPSDDDGVRVLVDRRWPRGVSKVRADLDEWCSAVAPSDALRKWYGHVPERFGEFEDRYLAELDDAERASALNQKIGDGLLDIIFGRVDMSSFDQLVKDWRGAGGDQIRAEFEQALQGTR